MKTTLTLFLLCFSLIQVQAKHLQSYQIFTAEGKETDFDKLVKASSEKQFVFFGEYHNSAIAHWLQYELTQELYAQHRKNLVLGGEMFEADNQYIIDEYLKGFITDKSFLDEVRLWPNYGTDYQPLIEFAKEFQVPFIATNIPRRYASMVYKQGLNSLSSLSNQAKEYIAPLKTFEFDSTIACYKNMIVGMGGHGGHNMAIAQAIKDATMAHFILKNSDKSSVFLHFNGAYHSDNYQGILVYLLKVIEKDKVLTISTVTQENTDALLNENKGIADFIICVKETVTTTH